MKTARPILFAAALAASSSLAFAADPLRTADVSPIDSSRAQDPQDLPPIVGTVYGAYARPIATNEDGSTVKEFQMGLTTAPKPEPRKYKKNDIIQVIVSEVSTSSTSGKGESKRNQDFDVALQQFIQLATSASGLPSVGVVGEPSKLPEIKFKAQNNRTNTADQSREDNTSARLAVTVVDVKPNGTLVVECERHITIDDEQQTFKLSGICRTQDITPDNTILSTQLADMNFSKTTKGSVRNGTKPGWLNKIIDNITPF